MLKKKKNGVTKNDIALIISFNCKSVSFGGAWETFYLCNDNCLWWIVFDDFILSTYIILTEQSAFLSKSPQMSLSA